MKNTYAVWTLAAVLLAGCGGAQLKTAVDKGELVPKFEDTKVDKKALWVRGIAGANPEHTNKTQRKAMSREAAIANAYQRALEFVKGTAVISNVRVKDAIAKDSTIESVVDGVIKGGEIVSTEYTDDDGCTVILRLDKEKFEAMKLDLPETPEK